MASQKTKAKARRSGHRPIRGASGERRTGGQAERPDPSEHGGKGCEGTEDFEVWGEKELERQVVPPHPPRTERRAVARSRGEKRGAGERSRDHNEPEVPRQINFLGRRNRIKKERRPRKGW